MDNPFLNGHNHLLKNWKLLRSELTKEKSNLEHLELVVKFWSKTPTIQPYTDWDNPNKWPDPWQFISEMNFDESAIAIGMEYTLLLSADNRWNSDRLELNLIATNCKSKQILILIVDNMYVLNYNYGSIVNLNEVNNTFVIQQKYKFCNKIHKIC